MTEKFTPELGGGKERSVTYETHFCQTPEDIDRVLNRDKYAYSYIYWNPQAKGVLLTFCKPNPEAFKQKQKQQHIERGYKELDENQAVTATKALFPLDKTIVSDLVLIRLYENGFKLFKQVDKEVKP